MLFQDLSFLVAIIMEGFVLVLAVNYIYKKTSL